MSAPLRAISLARFFSMSIVLQAAVAHPPAPGLIRDIEYSRPNGISLRLDASLPPSETKTPAVVVVHGGGWVAGDRRYSVEPLFLPLSSAGFAWFSISYRLATNVTDFGVAIDDVQSAIRFVKEHAAEYNVDPDRIALVGESAGGQLAEMAALRGSLGASAKAVVALYAPSDLVTLAKTSEYLPRGIRDQIRGTPWERLILAGLAQLSPINNIHSGMPHFLFIHGTEDSLVPFSQSADMCNRIRKSGGTCEVFPVQGGGHGIRWWEARPSLAALYKTKMIEWLKIELAPRQYAKS